VAACLSGSPGSHGLQALSQELALDVPRNLRAAVSASRDEERIRGLALAGSKWQTTASRIPGGAPSRVLLGVIVCHGVHWPGRSQSSAFLTTKGFPAWPPPVSSPCSGGKGILPADWARRPNPEGIQQGRNDLTGRPKPTWPSALRSASSAARCGLRAEVLRLAAMASAVTAQPQATGPTVRQGGKGSGNKSARWCVPGKVGMARTSGRPAKFAARTCKWRSRSPQDLLSVRQHLRFLARHQSRQSSSRNCCLVRPLL